VLVLPGEIIPALSLITKPLAMYCLLRVARNALRQTKPMAYQNLVVFKCSTTAMINNARPFIAAPHARLLLKPPLKPFLVGIWPACSFSWLSIHSKPPLTIKACFLAWLIQFKPVSDQQGKNHK
jgi:hypothetical protein